MASIVGKRQGGRTYYYLVESARVGGKPRIVSQRYLGSAEEVAARLSQAGPGEPTRTRHLAFGDVAATWALLGRLGLARVVDHAVGAGPPPVVGRDGGHLHPAVGGGRGGGGRRHGGRVRDRPWRAGVGHDQLRDLHRLGEP